MKDIEGYESRYSVNKDGDVYSEKSKKFLKPQVDHKGYLYVNLYDKYGEMKSIKVHRLVAITYIENPEDSTNHLPINLLNYAINC